MAEKAEVTETEFDVLKALASIELRENLSSEDCRKKDNRYLDDEEKFEKSLKNKRIKELYTPEFSPKDGWLTGRLIYEKAKTLNRNNIPKTVQSLIKKGFLKQDEMRFKDKNGKPRKIYVYRIETTEKAFKKTCLTFSQKGHTLIGFFKTDYFRKTIKKHEQLWSSFYEVLDLELSNLEDNDNYALFFLFTLYLAIGEKAFSDIVNRLKYLFIRNGIKINKLWDQFVINIIIKDYLYFLVDSELNSNKNIREESLIEAKNYEEGLSKILQRMFNK